MTSGRQAAVLAIVRQVAHHSAAPSGSPSSSRSSQLPTSNALHGADLLAHRIETSLTVGAGMLGLRSLSRCPLARAEPLTHAPWGGVEKNVAFEDAAGDLDDRIDAEYAAKYSRYAAHIIDAITSPEARATTVRLVPRSASE